MYRFIFAITLSNLDQFLMSFGRYLLWWVSYHARVSRSF